MRRIIPFVALVVVTALALQVPSFASSSRTPGQVLRFLDVQEQVEFLDVEPEATSEFDPSPGDTFFFSSLLRNAAGTRDVGRFESKCTALIGTVFKCAGTLLLSRGSIELAATVDFAVGDPIVSAVTGGTGRFIAVGGETVITATDVEGTSTLVVQLES